MFSLATCSKCGFRATEFSTWCTKIYQFNVFTLQRTNYFDEKCTGLNNHLGPLLKALIQIFIPTASKNFWDECVTKTLGPLHRFLFSHFLVSSLPCTSGSFYHQQSRSLMTKVWALEFLLLSRNRDTSVSFKLEQNSLDVLLLTSDGGPSFSPLFRCHMLQKMEAQVQFWQLMGHSSIGRANIVLKRAVKGATPSEKRSLSVPNWENFNGWDNQNADVKKQISEYWNRALSDNVWRVFCLASEVEKRAI